MKSRDASSGKSGKSKTSEAVTDSVALGDVIYVRLRSGSWWLAQVVDEKSVSESQKPSKRTKSQALVRLYGSYVYMYVDPAKCRSEFETILKNNNGSIEKILQEALEQDLPSAKKASRSKGSASKSKGTSSKSSASKRKSNGQDEEQNKLKGKKQDKMSSGDDLGSQSHERSSRKVRVMESLGLIAPAGSPFQRNGPGYNRGS